MVRQIRDAALIARIREIIAHGEYDAKAHPGTGRAGALIEKLLGIDANNDPVPDAVNWEIKTHTKGNLLSLFHLSPGKGSLNSAVRNFGWQHKNAAKYPPDALSFRCTISAQMQERGFYVKVSDETVTLAFDPASVASKHRAWLDGVRKKCGGTLDAPPTWTMDAIERSAGAKLRNIVLVRAVSRDRRYVAFIGAALYRGLKLSKFRHGLREGWIKVDFDARTQGGGLRDHGTKFRVSREKVSTLYESHSEISV